MLALLWAADAHAQTARAADCTALVGRTFAQTVITSASVVTGGSFRPPGAATSLDDLPPFCRVVGVIAPTPTSAIRFEVWMPLADWNGGRR
jgi:feruloyl esterase